MSTPGDGEREVEQVEHHPPSPVVLLLFTLCTGIGLVVAGAWILHGNVGITVVGAFGIVIGLVGLLYARGHL